jgi:hypothetical protein
MRWCYSLFLLLGLLFSPGCVHYSKAKGTGAKDKKFDWLVYSTDRRGTLVVPVTKEDGKNEVSPQVRFCAEPPPDIATKQQAKLGGDLTLKGRATIKGNVDFAGDVVELDGRTQTVLFLRESLYRLCEHSANGSIGGGDVKLVFETIVKSAVTLAEAEKIAAEAKKADADAGKAKADADKANAEAEKIKVINNSDPETKKKLLEAEKIKVINNSDPETKKKLLELMGVDKKPDEQSKSKPDEQPKPDKKPDEQPKPK